MDTNIYNLILLCFKKGEVIIGLFNNKFEIENETKFNANKEGVILGKWCPNKFGNLFITLCFDFTFKIFSYNNEEFNKNNYANEGEKINENIIELFHSKENIDFGIPNDLLFLNNNQLDFIITSELGKICKCKEDNNFISENDNLQNLENTINSLTLINKNNDNLILIDNSKEIKFFDSNLNLKKEIDLELNSEIIKISNFNNNLIVLLIDRVLIYELENYSLNLKNEIEFNVENLNDLLIFNEKIILINKEKEMIQIN